MRRTVPLVLAFVVGVVLLSQYFNPAFYDLYEIALEWSPVIAGVTMFLGIISFWQHHWRKTKKKARDWRFSALALFAFLVMVIAGVWGGLFGFDPPEVPPAWGEGEKEDWVSFEDTPDDAGGVVKVRWELVNRVGDIRMFEVHRMDAEEDSAKYVKIAEIEGNTHKIGRPVENRENLELRLDSILRNGEFDDDFEAWTQANDATIGSNEYRGNYAVLSAGSSLETETFTLRSDQRFRLTAISRNTAEGATLRTSIMVDGTALRTYQSTPQRDLAGTASFGEWTDAVPRDLEHDLLTPEGVEELTFSIRFEAVGGEMWLDNVALRPVEVEFQLTFEDAAPFNYKWDYPHYGERDSLLATHNPTFDVNLDAWTFEPPVASDEEKQKRRVERTDKEKKHCVELPAGTALLSARVARPEDPMGHKLSYRLRGWGKGGESGLEAEILAVGPGDRVEALGSTDWPPGGDWEVKELLVGPPPEGVETLQVRYTATGGSGAARVDDMLFLPVKTEPVAEREYVYKVVALDGDGAAIDFVASAPIAGEFEAIASWEAPHGLFMWLFRHVLVPMEATMFALLAFYIASAAFRAFRARSFEATLLLVTAIFVMIGRVPLGEQIWRPLGDFADWIMLYPNAASKRAIMMGVGLGMAATSLKLMLGIERTYLGKG